MDSAVALTERVYGLIQDKDWTEAIALLSELLEDCGPSNIALMSLLGFCQYSAEEYDDAASTYQKLCKLCPESSEYQVCLAQALAKAGAIEEANQVVVAMEGEEGGSVSREDLMRLKLVIKADSGDLAMAREMIDGVQGDPENLVCASAIAFHQGLYEEALSGYSRAIDTFGFRLDLAYNMAICSYKLKDYGRAMEVVTDAIGHIYEAHPELLSDHHHQSPDGNPVVDPSCLAVIQQSRLVECLNLKASIEYDSGDKVAATKTLGGMPTMLEEDKDAVTLHNEAVICDVESGNLDGCFKKLQHLISNNPSYPPETFANIILLYLQNGYEDLAATLLAENTDLTYELLSEERYSFLDASLLAATSPEDALVQFDALAKDIAKRIRKASKLISEAENEGDDDALATAHSKLDDVMKRYPPVLMAMARIHWEKKDYEAVERLLRESAEFCPDGKACATNLAHAYFMQGKHVEAAVCFEPLVEGAMTGGGGEGAVLDIPPVVLANLCVSFILSDQNDKAEALMDLVERAEEGSMALNSIGDPKDKPLIRLSTINLVIGTLYCQKNNFDFGIATICKSFEPYEQRLSSDTWHYCKTCLLALLDKLSKQMVTVADETTSRILSMLDAVDKHGQNLTSSGGTDEYAYVPSSSKSTISAEARNLKLAFLRFA